MKQDIKERMDKIRKGEVPKGYRMTNVGIIPDDLDVVEAKMELFLEELGR